MMVTICVRQGRKKAIGIGFRVSVLKKSGISQGWKGEEYGRGNKGGGSSMCKKALWEGKGEKEG